MRNKTLALLVAALAGCATLTSDSLDERFGQADPTRFDRVPLAATGGVSYRHDVKPILERRCVVCHGCYDAPCQLKLDSWAGLARGSSKTPVYDVRLLEAPPTRLGIDAQRPSQWRQLGFDPVLSERSSRPGNELAASVLYRSLQHKQAHPLPAGPVLPDSFDFSLDRAQVCPTLAEYDAHERKNPLAGMPYGLPALSPAEHGLITRWLQAGAPDRGGQVLPLVREGKAAPLFSYGILNAAGDIVRDPNFPDLPTFPEFLKAATGQDPSGPAWEAYRTLFVAGFAAQKFVVVPRETPRAVQDLYRTAFTRIFADPEYKEKRGTVIGEYDEVVGDAAEKAYAAGTVISEATREWIKEWLLRRFNHRLG